ncbi:MAG: TolC family protein [Cyclobacteriaceae bacterium]|jgi:outer membrane protein TolC|nr:TolC family protein [Cyclobacteriaceae bacterium]
MKVVLGIELKMNNLNAFIRTGFTAVMLYFSFTAKSQSMTDSVFLLPDTARAFTLESFYFMVMENHPVAKQAALLSDMAKQEIRLARGNFDPKIEVQYLTKNFKDTEYYRLFDGVVKFPTLFPVDPKIGVERNKGQYLNPERYISDEFDYQQFYAGVSLPLGKGLITDERRIALKQAELFQQMTEAEQIKMINKLLLEAAKDYWGWYNAYYHYRLLNRGAAVAFEIFRRTKINAEQGEAAVIDTIQAKITWQQRIIEQQEALLDFQNTGIVLSTYLWDSLGNPLALLPNLAPILEKDMLSMSAEELNALAEQARANHPELRKLSVKLMQLENERRLANEFLKPRLDLNYNFINQPFDPNFNTNLNWGEDYKFGLDFSFPVLIRKERAKLAQTRLKISGTEYERNLTERQIINEINTAYNALTNTAAILVNLSDMVNNYERLLFAELLNFENGESDLFKINVQQEKLIQSQTKLVKLLSDYEKQKAMLYWAAGVRNLGL